MQQRDIRAIVKQLTIEEKASLCSGANMWQTKAIDRLGIPSITMADGPHGLRKQSGIGDHLGLHESEPATCFPTAAGMAASWNRGLMERVGTAIGWECQAQDVAILLGPAANIKRSPLCGRNFEYFSEDPYLSSEMAAAHIRGVQGQGVGTSLKHYAANNQEHRRMSVDAVVDKRTLHEIYLASFEGAVKKAKPWTVMCAYNRVNGEYASEHPYLLTEVLRDEWGFEGFVVSDWGAVNERVKALQAGLELEMPASGGIGDDNIVQAVKNGHLKEEVLDQAVERLLTIVFRAVDSRKDVLQFDQDRHHRLAREAARESMVLLKNDGALPLRPQGKITVIGEFAVEPRYQGGGSSHVHRARMDIPLEEIKSLAGSAEIIYAQGYDAGLDETDEELLQEAVQAAEQADVAVLFVGLPDRYESEGYDRTHMAIPDNQREIIEAVAAVQDQVVVVLCNGSPVEMPWIDLTSAVLEAYLGGQAVGGAVAELLFGEVNPSGKLAETFPVRLVDNPSYLSFPGEGDVAEYQEGVFVGYRYYDTKGIEPLFPFGHGLSYTTFTYSNLQIDQQSVKDSDTVRVSVDVTNTGDRTGKEVVQLYVRDQESSVRRPDKELKAFDKVELAPGQSQTVTFILDRRAFAYYHVELEEWVVESGQFDILVGASSRDIVLTGSITVESTSRMPRAVITRNTLIGDLLAQPETREQAMDIIKQRTGGIRPDDDNPEMFEALLRYMPLRGLMNFSGGKYNEQMLAEDIEALNDPLFQSDKYETAQGR